MMATATKNLESNRSQDKDQGDSPPETEPVLCPHCRRTASNGIKCKGICVADSDY